jgi:hypothetical protein
MRGLIRNGARGLALLLLLVSVSRVPSPAEAGGSCALAPAAQAKPAASCCFTHPGYTGTCEVQPAEGETCGSILDYLNNAMSQGKNYCNNTALRGGWKSVPCEAK